MRLFKSLFSRDGDNESPSLATIESPKDLKIADMLKMEFSDIPLISGQTLKVCEQRFYDLSALENCKIVSVMEGADQRIYLSTSTVNPQRPLEVAVAILPDTVFKIFDQSEFVAIFDEPDNTNHRINRKISLAELNELQGFVAESYFQERTNEAYISSKDCRNGALAESDWTGFDYKLMVSDDRLNSIRIEVFDGGRTDVYLIAYLPLHKVEEYWPA